MISTIPCLPQTLLACLAISTAIAEPVLEHPSLAYGAPAAPWFGAAGINSPELYSAARTLSPLQYAASLPLVYAAQLLGQDPLQRARTLASAPLHYSSASIPVSYAANHHHPLASYSGAYTAAAAPATLTHPGAYHPSYPSPYAAPAFHHTPQYASYAAAPVQHVAGPPASLGGYASHAPSALTGAAAATAAAAAASSSLLSPSAAASGHHLSFGYHHPAAAGYGHLQQQAMDAAGAMAPHPPSTAELYGRGVPLPYPGTMAQGVASPEVARQLAAQLSAHFASPGTMGETRAQARSDRQ